MLPLIQARWMLKSSISACRLAAQYTQYRGFLTLAIETSADDTAVAIIETQSDDKSQPRATVHHHEKITANNARFKGIHPRNSAISHQKELPGLVQRALRKLPKAGKDDQKIINLSGIEQPVRKPTFIAATRGPGMRAGLSTGLDMAKGLSLAFDIPFVGVHHMQAHALTPRLVSALSAKPHEALLPSFPFRTLLISGGHSMLLNAKSLIDFEQEASTSDIAAGDCIDKMAIHILPPSLLEKHTINTNYGSVLEVFAFPNGKVDYQYTPPAKREELLTLQETLYGWTVPPPLRDSLKKEFSFSGLDTSIRNIVLNGSHRLGEMKNHLRQKSMQLEERLLLSRHAQRVLFEHIADRVHLVLRGSVSEEQQDRLDHQDTPPAVHTLVVSGGVASNRYFRHVLHNYFKARGLNVELVFPPIALCTDNAVMIAWAAIEMWEAGMKTPLDCTSENRWPLSGDWHQILTTAV